MTGMRAWVHRIAGMLCRAPGRAGALGRAREPPAAAHRRQPARRHDPGRGAPPGTPEARRRRLDQGGLSRSARHTVGRVAGERPSLRRSHAAQEPGVRAGRHRHPWTRHRRQHRHLHHRERRGAAAAPLPRRRPHRPALAHASAIDLSRDADVRALAGQLPRLGGAEPVVRGDGDLSRRTADADRTGRADRNSERAGVGELPADLRAAANRRPRLRRAGRSRGGGPHGAAERRRSGAPALAATPRSSAARSC